MELDGLRGVAVLLVVAGHSWSGVAPSYRRLIPSTNSASSLAFIGVNIFFVLSGFLITSLLLRERSESGGIGLRAFYGRRARRLLPALLLVVAVYVVYGILAGHGAVKVGGTAIRSLLYIENIGGFLHIPTSGWLGHTWSLAVEEQFYLVWPVLLIWSARKGRDGVALAAIVGALVTIVAREVLSRRGVDTYEVMHWDALMAGCFIAVRPWKPARVVVWLAVAGLVAQVVWYLSKDGGAPMTSVPYIGIAVAGAAFVSHAPNVAWLRNRVLRHFGTISYGLYLWHALLLRTGWPIPIALAIALLASEASYYGLERRFLQASRGSSAPMPSVVDGAHSAAVSPST